MFFTWLIVASAAIVSIVSSEVSIQQNVDELKNAIVEMKFHYDNKIALVNSKVERCENVLSNVISILNLPTKIQANENAGHHSNDITPPEHPNPQASNDSAISKQYVNDTYKDSQFTNSRNRSSRRTGHQFRTLGDRNERAAFDARLSHRVGDLGHSQPIVFDHVNINLENLYNPHSGVFTCDRPGTYVLYVRFLLMSGRTLYTELVVNGSPIHYMYTHDVNTYGHSATLAIQHLNHGDQVWTQTSSYQAEALTGDVMDGPYCSFAGFLLYPDEL